MKLFVLAPVLVCFFGLVAAVHAQDHIGGVIGVNRADVDFEFVDHFPRTTFAIGGILQHRLTERLSLLFQPMYLQKGSKFDDTGEIGQTIYVMKLAYIEIPVLFKLALRGQRTIRPFVLVGPSAGILLSAKNETSIRGKASVINFTDEAKTLDSGLAFGGGLNFLLGKKEIFVEVRYDLGLRKIQHKSGLNHHNQVIQTIMGITFPRGGN
ncbi:PorT family protein [candidate division KSB1 bacterium]|nr:PorT family protein [candidate division KSB1 bacterium]